MLAHGGHKTGVLDVFFYWLMWVPARFIRPKNNLTDFNFTWSITIGNMGKELESELELELELLWCQSWEWHSARISYSLPYHGLSHGWKSQVVIFFNPSFIEISPNLFFCGWLLLSFQCWSRYSRMLLMITLPYWLLRNSLSPLYDYM